MKLKIIIGAFIMMCAFSFQFLNAIPEAHAQKRETTTAATHMWLQNYENLAFVPVTSLEQCETYTRQASNLNSSEGLCYFQEKLVKRIECTKPLKRGETPSCK